MNRYLFKAKRKDNNEWVYGYLVIDKVGCSDNETGKDIYYIAGNSDNYVEVIQSTICQYTGLNDKNGKMIFENDIVKNHCGYKAIVKFGEYEYGYGFSIKHCGFYIQDIEFNDVFNLCGEKCEVIGNKFDKGDNNE